MKTIVVFTLMWQKAVARSIGDLTCALSICVDLAKEGHGFYRCFNDLNKL